MTTSPKSVRAVLFDAGGTLVRATPSVGHVYSGEAARFGVDISPETLNQHFGDAWRRLRPQDNHESPFRTSEAHERAWWRSLVMAVFDAASVRASFDNRFDAFFEALYERFESPDVWEVFDDVAPTLNALKRAGIRCAVVSNWDSRLPRLMDALGLADRFEFILTSAEAEYSKPHPAIFNEAIRRLGLRSEEVLNVGDAENEDVIGAEGAGLQALLLDRSRTSKSKNAVRALTGIEPLIRSR